MKLELKHLAAYLPYSVNLKSNDGRLLSVMTGIQYPYIECTLEHNIANHFSNFSLILRPLADLTKEIEVNREKFIPIHRLKQGGTDIVDFYVENGNYSCYDNEGHETFYDSKRMCFFNCYRGDLREFQEQYNAFQKLLEWHFDIFSLIDAGLAVDINTVKF